MKRVLAIVVLVLLAGNMALFAADKPITLSLWSGYPEMEVLFKHAAEEYKKIHPNVSVEVLTHPLREYEQKLSATIPSNTAADVLDVSGYALQKFVEAGFIPKTPPELVSFINKSGRYTEFTKKSITYKNTLYGVPFFQGKTALYWNTDMFKAAGLTRAPATYQEMSEYAKKLAVFDKSGNLVRSGHSLRLSGQGSGLAEKFWFVLFPMGG
ncbi:MAG TPA: extracellular solute-binding protein, partial [Rectinemataceae bacterium]|nr:extracellular solute-binding protein [Rectinemataceae bacterium]